QAWSWGNLLPTARIEGPNPERRILGTGATAMVHMSPRASADATAMYGYCMDWIPTIADRTGPLYLQIADALASDIGRGRLSRGQALPTHRALARALGIDLTTVTRAYAEARRRGLTEAK